MNTADISVMIRKLRTVVDTAYLGAKENDFVKDALKQPILTQTQIDTLELIYTRLFSLRT